MQQKEPFQVLNVRIRTMSSGELDHETGEVTIENHSPSSKSKTITVKTVTQPAAPKRGLHGLHVGKRKNQVVPLAKCSYPTETKQLLAEKLDEFHQEVSKLHSSHNKHALAQAQVRCPELLDDAFKLRFLRTEILDPQRAARRYAHYWELRCRLFGDKAFEPLTLTDEQDVEALRSGVVQIVPGHERVLQIDTSCLPDDKKKISVDSLARVQWYVFTKALEQSEDIQKFGGVFVINLHGTFHNLDLLKQISERANDGFPLRCAAACILNPPRFASTLVKIAKLFLRPRVRDKIHVISNHEQFLEHVGFSQDEIEDAAVAGQHDAWVDRVLFAQEKYNYTERMSL